MIASQAMSKPLPDPLPANQPVWVWVDGRQQRGYIIEYLGSKRYLVCIPHPEGWRDIVNRHRRYISPQEDL
jgi:hypothetical protein